MASRARAGLSLLTKTISQRAMTTYRAPQPGSVNSFCGAVGNTPLIRLNKLSEKTGAEIYGKAEFMEPGGSVKDRAALWVVQDAEKKGERDVGGGYMRAC